MSDRQARMADGHDLAAVSRVAAERGDTVTEPGWLSRLVFGDRAGQPDPQLAERVRLAAKYGVPVDQIHIAGPCCGPAPGKSGREAGS